ncbi:MAG: methionyl-tRNA formyltransferase [Lachnospiraceae bacterium]|nr:methionyl-tRNA formyltransferase [Lachnospiraceae bacterium]
MKALFMGTPDFASGILNALIRADIEVVCAVTQEDKQRGRGKELSFTAVKELALEEGIEVFQPHRIKDEESVSKLKEYDADIFIVAAYGQILSKEILDMPRYGCINVHASLLPKYRGAAPIQWAVINGDRKTGITIMQMDEGLDTGDILLQKEIGINDDETGESLFERLMILGEEAVIEALKLIEEGKTDPVKQDSALSSYAPMLSKETGLIDFSKDACTIERLVRGLYPWPGAYTYYEGKLLKIFSSEVVKKSEEQSALPDDVREPADRGFSPDEINTAPGTVVSIEDGILVATGDGLLKLKEVQLAGKKRMDASAFLRGFRIEKGGMFQKPE